MSHVVCVQTQVTSIEALKRACTALGLRFMEGQKTMRFEKQKVKVKA